MVTSQTLILLIIIYKRTDFPSKTEIKFGDYPKGYEPKEDLDLAHGKSVNESII